MLFANFLHDQFDVQTMAEYGWFFGRAEVDDTQKNESGTYALHTLKETETIARLATGIKRFDLPEEFNFIKLYQQVAEEDKGSRLEDHGWRVTDPSVVHDDHGLGPAVGRPVGLGELSVQRRLERGVCRLDHLGAGDGRHKAWRGRNRLRRRGRRRGRPCSPRAPQRPAVDRPAGHQAREARRHRLMCAVQLVADQRACDRQGRGDGLAIVGVGAGRR